MNYTPWQRILQIVLISVSASCASPPVQSYKDDDARLEAGQTFHWLTPGDATSLKLEDPGIDYMASTVLVKQRPEIEDKVRPMIEEALVNEGYKLDPGGTPDLYVTFFTKSKDQEWVSSWTGSTPGVDNIPLVISPDLNRSLLTKFRDGSVYLVLYSRASRTPVWTGVDSELKQAKHLTQTDIMNGIDRLMSELRKSS
jgi:hypothetical protein